LSVRRRRLIDAAFKTTGRKLGGPTQTIIESRVRLGKGKDFPAPELTRWKDGGRRAKNFASADAKGYAVGRRLGAEFKVDGGER
jgi:hypothetical protein